EEERFASSNGCSGNRGCGGRGRSGRTRSRRRRRSDQREFATTHGRRRSVRRRATTAAADESNIRMETSELAVGPKPGSGALTCRLQEFVRTPAFLSWVQELRRPGDLDCGGLWRAWSDGGGDERCRGSTVGRGGGHGAPKGG
ncbi:unnamed protein product, partial [Ectocarpus sp. 12 AP-2014]